jgi:hypothetical protein
MTTSLVLGKLLRLHVYYQRMRGAAVGDDRALTTHDFLIEDGTWPDAGGGLTHNYATMEGDFITFWNGLVTDAMVGGLVKPVEFRWYRQDSGDIPWGDPSRVTSNPTVTAAAATTGTCPPQVACSVTEITSSRRHWGRWYIPGIASARLNPDGSFVSNVPNGIAARAQTLYNSWTSRGVMPIVLGSVKSDFNLALLPGTSYLGHQFAKYVAKNVTQQRLMVGYPVTSLRIDDVPDIIRRRRFETALVRIDATVNA